MKTTSLSTTRRGLLLTAQAAIIISALPAHAVEKVKADNDSNMIGGGSWVGGSAPGPDDVAVFDDVYTIENNSLFTGGALNWSGVKVTGTNPKSKVEIANGTYSARVALGADGVDLSTAPRDLKIINVDLASDQTWNIASDRTFDVGSIRFSGIGNVEIIGGGLAIVRGDNGAETYSGTLTVSDGTLQLNGLSGFESDVVINDGGTLGGEIVLPNNLNLGSVTGGTLIIDPSTANILDVNVLTLTGTNTVDFTQAPAPGVVDVISYFSIVGDESNFALDPALASTLRTPPVFADSGGIITVEFFDGESITWTGSVDGEWDLNTTANWDNSGATNFFSLDSVTFGDSATTKTINIPVDVAPTATVFTNTAGNDYTVGGTGGISGGTLDKSGDGTLTLTGTNTFPGQTTITGGTLVADLTNGSPLSETSLAQVDAPGILKLAHDDASFSVFSGLFAGDGTVVLNAHNAAGSTDNHGISMTGDNTALTGQLLLEAPQSGTWRITLPQPESLGAGTITVESGAQIYAASATYTQPITLTGDGLADADGHLGALRMTGTSANSGGTNWDGTVTVTGTPGDSEGTVPDASIGCAAGVSGNSNSLVNGMITGGDLGFRSYSGNGQELFYLTSANSYGDSILFANDTATGGQTQLIVGTSVNSTATLGTGDIYLNGGAGGKLATLRIQREDGYTLPGDIISGGNTDATRLVVDSLGTGLSTDGKSITLGEDLKVAANVSGSIFNLDGGSAVSAAGITLGTNGTANLNDGTLALGSRGVTGIAGSALNLGGAAITATAGFTIDVSNITATVTAPSTIDIAGSNVVVNGAINGSSPLTINDSGGFGYFDFSIAGDTTVEAPLAGDAFIGKIDLGTLTLSGNSTHTGTLSVDEGSLSITGSLNGSNLVVERGTILTGGVLTGTLEIGNTEGGTLAYNGSPLAVTGDVSLLNTVEVNPFTNGPLPAGGYPLVTVVGSISGTADNLSLPSGFDTSDFRQTFSFNVDADSIDLIISGSPGDLAWNGPGDWDVNTSMPWVGDESFYQVDDVNFDDNATDGSVNIVGIVAPGSLTVNNDAVPYTFSGDGSIDGSATLLKQGPGTLTINSPNGYTGGTTIEGGSIIVDAENALGTGTVTISNGVLTVTQSVPQAITNPVTLGDSNTGTAETVLEYPLKGGNTLVLPLTVSGDAPDSKAILRTIGTSALSSGASYFGGPIFLDNHDLYHENASASRIGGLNGKISGTGDLYITKSPTGNIRTRLLNNSNDFVGNVYVEDGAYLQIGTGGTFGTVTSIPLGADLTIEEGSTAAATGDSTNNVGGLFGSGIMTTNVSGTNVSRLTLGNADKSGVFDGTMANQTTTKTLALTKTGTGTQVLNGACSFTSSTIIDGGILEINSPSYASAITVNAEGTLGGNGFLDSSVTATADGATIAPGASTGGLTVTGTVNLSTGGILAIEIDETADPKNDTLVASGSLDITDATLDVAVTGTATESAYVIASYGTLTGTFFTENIPAGYEVDYNYLGGNQIAVKVAGGNDYETWAQSYPGFENTAPTADPDADGAINDDEYAFGLDPTSGASVNPITVQLDPTNGTFTYTRRNPALTGLSYSVETSTDLQSWDLDEGATSSQNVTGTNGDIQTVEVTLTGPFPLSASAFFAHVVAE